MGLTQVNSEGIKDGEIKNADLDSSAAIDGSKLAAATTSAAGSMSAADKTKLDGVATSATANPSAPALTGSTDNTICTVTGANAIQGEANLTFDGNKLSVTPNKNSNNDGFEVVPADGTTASHFKVLGNNNAGADGRNGGATFIDANYYADASTIFDVAGRGTSRFSITGAGNVGIGTTSPATKLHVDGTASVGYDATHALRFYNQDKNNYSSITNNIATGTSNAQLAFRTGQGEALVIQNDKNVTVTDGDLVIGTAGHGISFAATGGPSNGSGDSELFADYEEGQFNPTILGWSQPGTPTYHGSTGRRGYYTKVGNMVTCWMYIAWEGISSPTGVLAIGGLPFSVKSTSGFSAPNGQTTFTCGATMSSNITMPDTTNGGDVTLHQYGGMGAYALMYQSRHEEAYNAVIANSGRNDSSSYIKEFFCSLYYPTT